MFKVKICGTTDSVWPEGSCHSTGAPSLHHCPLQLDRTKQKCCMGRLRPARHRRLQIKQLVTLERSQAISWAQELSSAAPLDDARYGCHKLTFYRQQHRRSRRIKITASDDKILPLFCLSSLRRMFTAHCKLLLFAVRDVTV